MSSSFKRFKIEKTKNKVVLNFQLMNKIPKFAPLYYAHVVIHNLLKTKQ